MNKNPGVEELNQELLPLTQAIIQNPTEEYILTALRYVFRLGQVDAATSVTAILPHEKEPTP